MGIFKKKWLILFLCFFGGLIGVHCFIVGRFKRGLLYLITFGFMGIGWLIDLILILTDNFVDRNGNVI